MNIDMLTHKFYEKFIEKEDGCRWLAFPDEKSCGGGYYEYYYAEDELYIIRDRIVHNIFFVKARSPKKAFETMHKAIQNEVVSQYEIGELIL